MVMFVTPERNSLLPENARKILYLPVLVCTLESTLHEESLALVLVSQQRTHLRGALWKRVFQAHCLPYQHTYADFRMAHIF